MTPTAITHRHEHAIIAERREQEHYNLPRRSCLGSGCCDWCGRPMDKCTCITPAELAQLETAFAAAMERLPAPRSAITEATRALLWEAVLDDPRTFLYG